jgi:hypothetical protein
MFQTKFVQKIKTNFKFDHLFSENRAVYENVEKCSIVRRVTDGGKAHAHSMLDN